jgi:DNA-binding beta-propeller fold protein YncE
MRNPLVGGALIASALLGSVASPAVGAPQMLVSCSALWESSDVQALAFAPDGSIFSANRYAGRVCHYSADGTELSTWSLPPGPGGVVFWPIGIDVDAAGDVYVSDFDSPCVYKCSAEGAVLDTIGWGTLVAPRGVTCDPQSGHVYVCDGHGYAIREFGQTGELLRSIPADWYISDVALGDNGELYASAYNGRVYRFAADGALLATWQPADAAPNTSFPSIERGPDGRVHVVDRAATRVLVLTGDLQKIGEWLLDCAGLRLQCRFGDYVMEVLTSVDLDGQGQVVLGTDCLSGQVAVFPSALVPVRSTTWGRVKTLYR